MKNGLTDSQVAMHHLVNAFIKSHLLSYVQYIQHCYVYRIMFHVERYMLNIIGLFVVSSAAAQPVGECYDQQVSFCTCEVTVLRVCKKKNCEKGLNLNHIAFKIRANSLASNYSRIYSGSSACGAVRHVSSFSSHYAARCARPGTSGTSQSNNVVELSKYPVCYCKVSLWSPYVIG